MSSRKNNERDQPTLKHKDYQRVLDKRNPDKADERGDRS